MRRYRGHLGGHGTMMLLPSCRSRLREVELNTALVLVGVFCKKEEREKERKEFKRLAISGVSGSVLS